MPVYPEPDLTPAHGGIAIALTVMAYLAHYSMGRSIRLNRWLRRQFDEETASVRKVLWHRLSGTLLFGFIPVLVVLLLFGMPVSRYGLNADSLARSLGWWIPVAMGVVALTYFTAGSKANLSRYPQIRTRQWNYGLILLSALSWTAYLAGYEFMFRGFLLFSCFGSFGYWPAIVINVALYSLVHLPKGSRETLGSLFLGFVLCHVTILLGSCWFAFLVHSTLALSNEWFSLAWHPEMKLAKKQATE
jgi:membrane protease YdiL (CAAX protease family)